MTRGQPEREQFLEDHRELAETGEFEEGGSSRVGALVLETLREELRLQDIAWVQDRETRLEQLLRRVDLVEAKTEQSRELSFSSPELKSLIQQREAQGRGGLALVARACKTPASFCEMAGWLIEQPDRDEACTRLLTAVSTAKTEAEALHLAQKVSAELELIEDVEGIELGGSWLPIQE